MSAKPLSELLKTIRATMSGGFSITVGEDWSQGRTIFGGVIAAIANECIRLDTAAQAPLRALQVAYVGPNAPGDLQCDVTLLREGKNVTLASAIIRSQQGISTTVTAIYGAARESMLNIRPAPALWDDLGPSARVGEPFVAQFAPHFLQHFERKQLKGAGMFSGATDSRLSLALRFQGEEGTQMTEAHALAMMDATPTPALLLLDKLSPASTVTWTIEILEPSFDFAMDEWWQIDSFVEATFEGYVMYTSQIINPAGKIAAIGRQIAVVYG